MAKKQRSTTTIIPRGPRIPLRRVPRSAPGWTRGWRRTSGCSRDSAPSRPRSVARSGPGRGGATCSRLRASPRRCRARRWPEYDAVKARRARVQLPEAELALVEAQEDLDALLAEQRAADFAGRAERIAALTGPCGQRSPRSTESSRPWARNVSESCACSTLCAPSIRGWRASLRA
jgi:hypothetical protein